MDRQILVHPGPGLWPPNWPMGLTMLRLLLLPGFLWTLLLDAYVPGRPHHRLAVGIFAIMAITDKLDGYLARRFHQTSKLGAVLDPLADKLLIACSVMLLSFDWIAPVGLAIPSWVVIAVYGKDLITVAGILVLLSLVGKVAIIPRPLGKISTVVQLAMVMAVLMAPHPQTRWLAWWPAFVHGLWWAVLAIAVLACADYVRFGIAQFSAARRRAQA